MLKTEYKELYIYNRTDTSVCQVHFPNGTHLITVKSLRAAKLAITKFLSKCPQKYIK